MFSNVREAISTYLEYEIHPETKESVRRILDDYPNGFMEDELNKRFNKYISFGTAGVRGRLEGGFNRVNYVTVCGIAQGICKHLMAKNQNPNELYYRTVFIGYDGRTYSKNFANLIAAIFMSKRYRVIMWDNVVATPLVAFGVVYYYCEAGIQVTASHNPKDDNGIKLYKEDGFQVPPDEEAKIIKCISESRKPVLTDIHEFFDFELFMLKPEAQRLIMYPDRIMNHYMNIVLKKTIDNYIIDTATKTYNAPAIVYTPLHGVGKRFIESIFDYYGITQDSGKFIIVPQQAEPDKEFPTVSFPNPEENHTLDLAMETADKYSASIIIANDPDADRFSVAEKLPSGKWYIFKGDEVGAIFAGYLMSVVRNIPKEKQAYFTSAVSSRMLYHMTKTEGCQYYESMTGFKNILSDAKRIQEQNVGVPIFAYEESLGYAVDIQNVPDKDGLSSTALFIQILHYLSSKSYTVFQYLQSLYSKYGTFITQNSYAMCQDPATIKSILDEFRNQNYSTQLGTYKVTRIRDITTGYDSQEPNHICQYPKSPNMQMLTIYFHNEAQITLRASGTEPKLKYYAEIRTKNFTEGKRQLSEIVSLVINEILQPSKNQILFPQ